MEISGKIRIIDLALYLEEHNAIVIGDVHFGFENQLHRQGILVPKFHYEDTIKKLEKIFSKTGRVKDLIINGDLKHEFGSINPQEWKDINKLIDHALEMSGKISLIKGNHDILLHPVVRRRNIDVKQHEKKGDIYITHGHQIPSNEEFKSSSKIIIGNEHPAVTLRSGVRAETYKCFLKGKWQKKELIVMPSFHELTIGTDVLKEKFISPFIKSAKDFEAYICGDETLNFGKVKNVSTLG